MRYPSVLIGVALVLIGCSTDFQPYEGTSAVRKGTGGTRQVVEGMDWWTSGEPPRPYRVLGTIVDNRSGSISGRLSYEPMVVGAARRQGGDAVMEISNPGFSGVTEINRRTVKLLVIKYL
jgi:hypothetical protein